MKSFLVAAALASSLALGVVARADPPPRAFSVGFGVRPELGLEFDDRVLGFSGAFAVRGDVSLRFEERFFVGLSFGYVDLLAEPDCPVDGKCDHRLWEGTATFGGIIHGDGWESMLGIGAGYRRFDRSDDSGFSQPNFTMTAHGLDLMRFEVRIDRVIGPLRVGPTFGWTFGCYFRVLGADENGATTRALMQHCTEDVSPFVALQIGVRAGLVF